MNYFYFFIDDTRWTTVTKSNTGQLDEFSVSYQSLLPSTSYLFRVVAFNEYGISYPAYSDDVVGLYFVYFYLKSKFAKIKHSIDFMSIKFNLFLNLFKFHIYNTSKIKIF